MMTDLYDLRETGESMDEVYRYLANPMKDDVMFVLDLFPDMGVLQSIVRRIKHKYVGVRVQILWLRKSITIHVTKTDCERKASVRLYIDPR